ncbi:hypothetical protein SprV_0301279000 [Sparganum proliferum]
MQRKSTLTINPAQVTLPAPPCYGAHGGHSRNRYKRRCEFQEPVDQKKKKKKKRSLEQGLYSPDVSDSQSKPTVEPPECRRLHFQSRVTATTVHELLLVDDCVLKATSEEDMQRSMDLFAVA